mmetsp:Transcript_6948/g.11002  ORF Transcript_6948/g.11002 Transcript_6948/m.11002 type:complete len:119 (+) Transcript_6948:48-404(+)
MNRVIASIARSGRASVALRPTVGFRFNAVRGFSDTFLPVPEVTERVIAVVKSFDKVDGSKVTDKSNFATDLGLDSLDTVEVLMALEEEFVIEIPEDQAEKLYTCEDAIKFIASHPQVR